jgi:hypothetical protein
LALASGIALPCAAQPAPPDAGGTPSAPATDGDRAVELGRHGLAAFQAGKWLEAHAKFAEANALSASPVFVLYMARSLRNAGRLLEARVHMRSVRDMPVAPGAPESWHQAHRDARAELEALETSIPSIVIALKSSSTGGAAITVDDAPQALGRRIALDPGAHSVVARAGAREVTRTIVLRAGAHEEVTLELPDERAGAGRHGDRDRTPRAVAGPLFPGVLALGVGAAGLGVGAVTGAIALGRAGDAKDRCPNDLCRDADRKTNDADVAAANDLATVSTVAFAIGGAATAAGVVLLLTRPGGADRAARLELTPQGARMRGVF